MLASQLSAQAPNGLLRECEVQLKRFTPNEDAAAAIADSIRRYRIRTITETRTIFQNEEFEEVTQKSSFDREGRLLEKTSSSSLNGRQRETCTYAPGGNLQAKTIYRDDTISSLDSFFYDARDRLIRVIRRWPGNEKQDSEIQREYDREGHLIGETKRYRAQQYYDHYRYENGRPAGLLRLSCRTECDTLEHISFRYDSAGRLTEMRQLNNLVIPVTKQEPWRVMLEYDTDGRISRFREIKPLRKTDRRFSYDAQQRLHMEQITENDSLQFMRLYIRSGDGRHDTILTQIDPSPLVFPNMEQLVLSYDQQGRIIREEKFHGQRYYMNLVSEMQRKYNSKGQLILQTYWLGDKAAEETRQRMKLEQKFSRKGLLSSYRREGKGSDARTYRYTFY